MGAQGQSHVYSDHQGGRGGGEKVSPPGRQAVPRFQDQVSAPEEGQVHGQTSPEIYYRQTVHPRPLRRELPGWLLCIRRTELHCVDRRNSVAEIRFKDLAVLV